MKSFIMNKTDVQRFCAENVIKEACSLRLASDNEFYGMGYNVAKAQKYINMYYKSNFKNDYLKFLLKTHLK